MIPLPWMVVSISGGTHARMDQPITGSTNQQPIAAMIRDRPSLIAKLKIPRTHKEDMSGLDVLVSKRTGETTEAHPPYRVSSRTLCALQIPLTGDALWCRPRMSPLLSFASSWLAPLRCNRHQPRSEASLTWGTAASLWSAPCDCLSVFELIGSSGMRAG